MKMKTYRVLKGRFVYLKRAYGNGDEFRAVPSQLLRRAITDGDLEEVTKPAKKEA